ncbi:signal peptidase II [Aquimonas sp.]|jgi:signal peptidase II|uniref:signal peptidase II n=1 Tax=Aquimonas sp. TaxID=1872588 RepID=UPI0037C0BA91
MAGSAHTPALKHSALIWLLLSTVVIALDLWTKQIALDHLQYNQPVPVIDGWLNWTLLYNYGAAFSFLGNAGGWQKWLFSGLAIGISALLTWWLARLPRADWRQALPFALVIGGAIGNLVDRLRFGYVVDFIDVYYKTHHWPAFNIADSAIVLGAILIAVSGFGGGGKRVDS